MKFLKIVAAVALAISSSLVATPAFAHDGVVSTTPSDKSTIDAGKVTISITYEEDILDVNDGHGLVIQIMTPSGQNASNNCLKVDGKTLSVAADLDEAGTYNVAWQAVSSDGHTNTGVFTFTVKNDSGYKANGVPTCKPVAETDKPDAPEGLVIATQEPTDHGTDHDGDHDTNGAAGTQTPLFVGILVVLATLIGGNFYRRRKSNGGAKGNKDGSDAS